MGWLGVVVGRGFEKIGFIMKKPRPSKLWRGFSVVQQN
jgi:hypothetical protein